VPGITKKQIALNITGERLTLSGERPTDGAPASARYHRRERAGGKFQRALELPGEVEGSQAEAGLVNGILTVALPKAKPAAQRQIRITG
jgi:HSP20 family protein